MSMMSEFKAFAMRGNVIDLAVGVVIGAAFGKIVGVLVEQVLMPPIGLLIGGVDFSAWAITLREAAGEQAAVVIGIGAFLNSIIQFTIVAFAIFMVIRLMNRMQQKEAEKPAAPAAPSAEQLLLSEIRDLLKNK